MRVGFSKSNLDIDLISSYIFAEHPHFTLIIQRIHYRTFGIIVAAQIHDNLHSLIRSYTQLNETVLVLLAVITETYSEDFDLQTKILQKLLDLFLRNLSAKIAIFF